MTKQIEVTWTEVLTQTAIINVPDDLDVDADLDETDPEESVIHNRILDITGGQIKDCSVTERQIEGWRVVGAPATGKGETCNKELTPTEKAPL